MTYSRPLMLRVEKAVGMVSGTRTACASIASIRIVPSRFAPSPDLRKFSCVNTVTHLLEARVACRIAGMEREPAVAVRRVAALLLTLGGDEALQDGGLGVKRLSELTGNEISRVSRTLEVLSELRLVERDSASLAYRL